MKYSDIEKMEQAGLISAAQAEEIARHFRISARTGTRNHLVFALSALGGILLLFGIAMIVSANWDFIPPRVKQISAAALMLGFWTAGLKFVFGKNPRPILGETFCAVGAGMLLANIALYWQIYQISSEPWHAFGAWFSGIFAIPWIVRLRGVFALSLVAAAFFVGTLSEEFLNFGDMFFVLTAFAAAVSSLGIFLTSLSENARERFRGYGEIALLSAFPCAILMLQTLCYDFVLAESVPALSALAAAGMLVFLAQLKTAFSLARERRIAGIFFAAALGFLFAFPAVLSVCFAGTENFSEIFSNVAMMLAFFCVGVFSMFFGGISSRKFYVNVGALMVFLAALSVVFRVVGSLSASGIALIVAGIFLIGFGLVLERFRKKFNAKISAEGFARN